MKWRKLISIFLSVALFMGIANFCHSQTEGFWLQKIVRKIGDDPSLAITPLTPDENKQVEAILDQPYSYLGMGSQCFAFESADQQYVIKFFKLDPVRYWYLKKIFGEEDWTKYASLYKDSWLTLLPLPKSLHRLRDQLMGFRNQRIFTTLLSCKISYDDLKEETGTVYLHLQTTSHFHKKMKLFDKIGIAHEIDPNSTFFIVQKKAELVYPHLSTLMQKGEEEKAKASIRSLLHLLVSRAQKGIANIDAIIGQNYGFIREQAVEIDTGSFVKDEAHREPHVYKRELLYVSLPLRNWLESHYPALVPTYDQELLTLLSS